MTGQLICTRCVMDSSNPHISFDGMGHCNCCSDAIRRMPFEWFRVMMAAAGWIPLLPS